MVIVIIELPAKRTLESMNIEVTVVKSGEIK